MSMNRIGHRYAAFLGLVFCRGGRNFRPKKGRNRRAKLATNKSYSNVLNGCCIQGRRLLWAYGCGTEYRRPGTLTTRVAQWRETKLCLIDQSEDRACEMLLLWQN